MGCGYSFHKRLQFQNLGLGTIRLAIVPLVKLSSLKVFLVASNQLGWVRGIWCPTPTIHLLYAAQYFEGLQWPFRSKNGMAWEHILLKGS